MAVPNMLGMSFEDAADSLQTAGLLFQTTSRSDSTQPAGRVLAQDPKVGDQVPQGTAVALEVNELQSLDGKVVTLQADTGKHLSRCNGCIPGGAYPDSAFIHEPNVARAHVQWTIVVK